ncbi:MAG: glycosyltransferase [Symploca sp. SIO2D2]|nr:glycosyltransferase [Symploca sp. SIO2D2]
MKLLRLIHTMNPNAGGPSEGIRQVSPYMAEKGIETTIATLDDPDVAECPGATTIALGPTNGFLGRSTLFDEWLEENIEDFDAAIVHGLWLYNGYGFWRAWKRKKAIPYFVYPHGMLDPWFKKAYPLKHLKKAAYWLLRERKLLQNARYVLFTSENEMRLARDTFKPYKVAEKPVKYGIDSPDFDKDSCIQTFDAAFPEATSGTLILFLSRIHPKKGCPLLLEAFAQTLEEGSIPSSSKLVMAGPCEDPTYLDTLKSIATQKGIAERVIWTGMLQGELKWGAMHKADLFALPSHQENFGIAVAEALACSLPVATTTQVNIWREIEADQAGIIKPDTTEGTAAALREFFEIEPSERDAMRSAAKRCFENRFHIRSAAQNLSEILSADVPKTCLAN